jgi:non-specific serine/threonine protein kinase
MSGLPLQLTRLIGRDREIEEVGRLLGSARLLTLTGAGGSGKTRLAAEVVSRRVSSFTHGAIWVELAPLSDPAFLPQQILIAFGAREDPSRTDADTLVQLLRDRSPLLVLDNCEHLVDACAALAERLLRSCPSAKILTTSREALGIAGEQAWLVPPLSLPELKAAPTAADAGRSDAVRLFIERAQAVLPSFALTDANAGAVTQICRRLDGIPLAIELAAARIKLLSPGQIAERLDDAFRLLTAGGRTALPRHRTLRETIDWSHALLTPGQQVLLRRLSVFVGGFSLEAAEAVCTGGEIGAGEVLDLLAALVEKSLVERQTPIEETRFRLLETVRQYGMERLAEAGESEELRRRHAGHFLDLAETAAPYLIGGAGILEWRSRIEQEIGNLRAVAEWSAEDPGRAEVALRLSYALHWFWLVRGFLKECRQRLTLALEHSERAPALLRGRALVAFAYTVLWQGDPEAGLAPAREGVALLRQSGDLYSFANAVMVLAAVVGLAGDPDASLSMFEEGLAISRPADWPLVTGPLLYWRGVVAQAKGDFALAHASFEEALQMARELDHSVGRAHSLVRLGRLAVVLGEAEEARHCLTAAVPTFLQLDDRWGMALVLEGLAAIAAAEGRPERAVRLLGGAASRREWVGALLSPAEREEQDRLLAGLRASLAEAVFTAEWEAGRAMSGDEISAYALEEEVKPAPAVATVEEKRPAPSLRVLTLGALEISLNGQIVEDSAWSSARAKELFLFFLCHPEGCTKEEAGLALWPESSAEQLRNTFHVTLHRLRKALDDTEWIVHDGNRYRMNAALPREFDVEEFERRTGAALKRLAAGQDGVAEMADALVLYRGDFLAGEAVGEWCVEIRERFKHLYLDGLLAYGDALMGRQRYAEAAEAFRRLLGHDEIHEGAGRRLMICLTRQGERSQALRLYKRLAEAVRRELDCEPEEETTDLYERLQNAEAV